MHVGCFLYVFFCLFFVSLFVCWIDNKKTIQQRLSSLIARHRKRMDQTPIFKSKSRHYCVYTVHLCLTMMMMLVFKTVVATNLRHTRTFTRCAQVAAVRFIWCCVLFVSLKTYIVTHVYTGQHVLVVFFLFIDRRGRG